MDGAHLGGGEFEETGHFGWWFGVVNLVAVSSE